MGVSRGNGIVRVPAEILEECHHLADLCKGLVGETDPGLHYGLDSAHRILHGYAQALARGEERGESPVRVAFPFPFPLDGLVERREGGPEACSEGILCLVHQTLVAREQAT